MGSSIRLGRIAGIEISVNWSWLVVFALITWSLATGVFPSQNPGLSNAAYATMAVVAALCFFASLLLHELGHALQARRERVRIDGITLWLFGGVARLGGSFSSAGAEFRIAIAGPLVSLAIGALLAAVHFLVTLPEPVDGVVFWIGVTNLGLLAFNLLPALPLDGGRVLRSGLWYRWRDFRRATLTALRISRAIASLLVVGGVVLLGWQGAYSGLWLSFIGWFLLMAAASESRAAHSTAPDVTVALLLGHPERGAHPVVVDDRIVALADFRPAGGPPSGSLPRVEPETPLLSAYEQTFRDGETRALVVRGGTLLGVLALARPSPLSLLLRLPFRSPPL
jgi:Zn-dependent protease